MVRPKDNGVITYTPLIPSENTPSQATDDSAVADKQRSLWARLGTVGILILGFGSLVLVLSVLPLAWLWAESLAAARGQRPSSVWLSVVKADWTTRIVTICTAFLRAVVTTQASVATTMFAAIILERVGAALADTPFYSIARAVNGSPGSLLWTPSMPLRGTGLSRVTFALIVLEVSVTTAVQVLSTLLVVDFGNVAFTDTTNVPNIRILNDSLEGPFDTWWSIPPAAVWTFAEHSEPFVSGHKYHDTGHTYRAFLPYTEAAQRTSLRYFRGPAPITDQRVVCVQPALRGLRLDARNQYCPRLSGQIAMMNGTYPMLQRTETQPYVQFTCALPGLVTRSTQEHGLTSLCWPRGVDWKVLVEDPLVIPGPVELEGTLAPGFPEGSTMFMLLDLVSTAAVGYHMVQDVRTITTNDSSPWMMVGNGTDVPVLRVTACMANLGVDTFTAAITSEWAGSEPSMSWNRLEQRYDTGTTRIQLGAVLPQRPLNHRGVLTLPPREEWERESLFSDEKATSFVSRSRPGIFTVALAISLQSPQISYETMLHYNQTANDGVILSSRDQVIQQSNAHDAHTVLFQDTLNQTQSPAIALQALLTRICQMIYYARLLRLDESEPAEMTFSREAVLRRIGWGFTSVLPCC